VTHIEIIGRHTSHFTRLPLIVAHELGSDYEFTPIYDLMDLDAASYGSHPGLRLPTLRHGDQVVFGAMPICRYLAELAAREAEIVWPPQSLEDPFLANFHELTMQAMATQVTVVITTQVAKVDPENVFARKSIRSLTGMLEWLDENAERFLSLLPDRLLSITEAGLFCLIEHVRFRHTASLESYSRLTAFADTFGVRESARDTYYRLDR